jgi:hypothetical protein
MDMQAWVAQTFAHDKLQKEGTWRTANQLFSYLCAKLNPKQHETIITDFIICHLSFSD